MAIIGSLKSVYSLLSHTINTPYLFPLQTVCAVWQRWSEMIAARAFCILVQVPHQTKDITEALSESISNVGALLKSCNSFPFSCACHKGHVECLSYVASHFWSFVIPLFGFLVLLYTSWLQASQPRISQGAGKFSQNERANKTPMPAKSLLLIWYPSLLKKSRKREKQPFRQLLFTPS